MVERRSAWSASPFAGPSIDSVSIAPANPHWLRSIFCPPQVFGIAVHLNRIAGRTFVPTETSSRIKCSTVSGTRASATRYDDNRNAFGGFPMTLSKSVLLAALGTSALVLSAANASAAVACTGDVCWHTPEVYEYPPSARVIIHEDGWQAGPTIVWREHPGRGYWEGDRWTTW